MGILEDLFATILPAGGEPDIQNPNIKAALDRLRASANNGVVATNPATLGIEAKPATAPAEAPKPLVEKQTVPALPATQTPPERTAPRGEAPAAGMDLLSRAAGILLGTPGQAADFLPGGARDQQMQAKNATYKFLVENRGLDHDAAMAALSNPTMLQTELLRGEKPPESRTRMGPFNQQIIENWNPKTKQWEPEKRTVAAPAQATPTTATTTAATATPATLGMAPAEAKTAEAAIPATSTGLATQGDYVVGPASSVKPAEGYVQKSDGAGKFLWNKDGTPALEEKQGVGERAKERSKSNEEDRNKALAGIETVRRIQELKDKLDQPLAKPFKDKTLGLDHIYDKFGDVVGPWALPRGDSGGGGTAGQIVGAISTIPNHVVQVYRNMQGQRSPEWAGARSALNELETMLTSLQGSRVKELFGSQNLSDADREAAAKTVGTLTAQNSEALKNQLSVGERDSYTRIDRALKTGLITADDVPKEILAKGVMMGLIKPDSIRKGN